MCLSRRSFTKEFKQGAVRRLELGASVAEVAALARSTPVCCTAGAESFGNIQLRHFLGRGTDGLKRAGLPIWSARSVVKRWKSFFCVDACSVSKSSGGCRH